MAAERMLFVNLPVRDLTASRTFFSRLGLTFNDMFSDDSCACMVLSDKAFVMLLAAERFADFTAGRPIAGPGVTEALLCLSAESREGVDTFADTALAAGAARHGEAMDHGFMYGRSFTDLDGHVWEVMWMSQEAVEKGPADMATA